MENIENCSQSDMLKAVFEQPSVGIVIVSPTNIFEDVNPAFAKMMGYSVDELKTKSFVDITHPSHVGQDEESAKKLINKEISFYQTEKRYIKKDGFIVWANIFVSPIFDNQGRLAHFITTVIDITESKNEEEKVKELNRLMMDRELRMAALKEENKVLQDKINEMEKAETR